MPFEVIEKTEKLVVFEGEKGHKDKSEKSKKRKKENRERKELTDAIAMELLEEVVEYSEESGCL